MDTPAGGSTDALGVVAPGVFAALGVSAGVATLGVEIGLGAFDGALDGATDGAFEAATEGAFDGAAEGAFDGAAEGAFDGAIEGAFDGAAVGTFDGAAVDAFDGAAVGALEGAAVGALDGTAVGAFETAAVGALDVALDIALCSCADASGSNKLSGSIDRGVGVATPEASGGLATLEARAVAVLEAPGSEE